MGKQRIDLSGMDLSSFDEVPKPKKRIDLSGMDLSSFDEGEKKNGTKNGGNTSITPSKIYGDNPFGGKPVNEFIGKENATRINKEVENQEKFKSTPLTLGNNKQSTLTPNIQNSGGFIDNVAQNLSGQKYSPLDRELSDKLKLQQAAFGGNIEEIQNASKLRDKDTLQQGLAEGEEKTLDGNWSKYWYNKVLEGFGQVGSGLGDFATQLGASEFKYDDNGTPRDRFQQAKLKTGEDLKVADKLAEQEIKDYRENTAPTIREYLKNNIGANVDKRLEGEYNNGTFTGALGGLFSSSPAIGFTILSGGLGTVAMGAQMFDNSIESINSTEQGKNVDETTKTFFAGGVALASTILEKTSLNFILKSKSGIVSDFIARRALANAIKATDSKVTGDVFTKFINKEVASLTNKYVVGGARAVDAALVEYGTEFSQEGASIAGELLVNKSTGKSVFNTKDINSWDGFMSNLKRSNKAGVSGLIAGGFLGGVASLANLKKNKIEHNEQIIRDIDRNLLNEGLSENTKELLVQNKIKMQQELDAYAKKLDVTYNALTDSQKDNVNTIVEQKAKIKEAINDPSVTPEIKAALESQDMELDKALAEIKPEYFNLYDEAVKSSETVEDAFKQAVELSETNKLSDTLVKKYNPTGELSDLETFKKFYDEVKAKNVSSELPSVPENYNIVDQKSGNNNEVESNKRNKELFPDVSNFGNQIGKSGNDANLSSYNEVKGVGFSEYTNPASGLVDVYMAGTSDNDYVGFVRVYENGKPTNRFTSKMENKSNNKADLKTMLSEIQKRLPENHEYTESTSISTDGLNVFSQQLNHGYEIATDANGNVITNLVGINGDSRVNSLGVNVNQGNFDNIEVRNNEDFETVKKALLPFIQKLGLTQNDIVWEDGTVKINLPVLRKKSNNNISETKSQTNEVEPINQSTANSIPTPKETIPNTPIAETTPKQEAQETPTPKVQEAGSSVAEDAKPTISEAENHVKSLNDNEEYTAYVSNINEIPKAFRDRAQKVSGEIKTRKSFLGIPYGKETTINSYRYKFTGKEAKSEFDRQKAVEQSLPTQEVKGSIPQAETPVVSGIKSTEAIVDEVKPTVKEENKLPIQVLEEEYTSKNVDELVKLKKELYPNPDTTSPMSAEEKLLDKVIAKKYSDVNAEIIAKRKLKEQEAQTLATETAQATDKSNLDLEFIADESIPKETVNAYNKKGKLAGTTEVPNEKIVSKQNEIRTNLETLKKFTKCLTA